MRLEFTACTPGADGGDEDDDKNADVTGIDGANTADDDDTEEEGEECVRQDDGELGAKKRKIG